MKRGGEKRHESAKIARQKIKIGTRIKGTQLLLICTGECRWTLTLPALSSRLSLVVGKLVGRIGH